MKNISFYRRYEDLTIEVPWHLSLGKNNIIKDVNLNDLKCSVIDKGITPIEDTPHFQYVQGYKNAYIEYVNRNIEKTAR